MKLAKLDTKQLFVFSVLNIFIGICLSGITLLSLPFFYEQTLQNMVWILLVTSFLFSGLVLLVSSVFIMPFLSRLRNRNSHLFLAIFTLLLILGITFGNANLWAVPEMHHVEFCFTAGDDIQSLSIEKIMDPNSKRLFPPNSFGFTRYPIIVASGTCVDGRVINLASLLTEALMGNQLTIDVQDPPPSGRFYASINDMPAVVTFGDSEEKHESNSVLLTDGFDKAERIEKPWQSLWMYGLKAVFIIFSSIFISLFLFGLTERIQTFQDHTGTPTIGAVNAEK